MTFNDSRSENNQISASSYCDRNLFPHHVRLDFNINEDWEPKRRKLCKLFLNFTFKNEKKTAMRFIINEISNSVYEI